MRIDYSVKRGSSMSTRVFHRLHLKLLASLIFDSRLTTSWFFSTTFS